MTTIEELFKKDVESIKNGTTQLTGFLGQNIKDMTRDELLYMAKYCIERIKYLEEENYKLQKL
jgi:hypothetical protein